MYRIKYTKSSQLRFLYYFRHTHNPLIFDVVGYCYNFTDCREIRNVAYKDSESLERFRRRCSAHAHDCRI